MRHNSAAIGFSPNTSTLKGKNEGIYRIFLKLIGRFAEKILSCRNVF